MYIILPSEIKEDLSQIADGESVLVVGEITDDSQTATALGIFRLNDELPNLRAALFSRCVTTKDNDAKCAIFTIDDQNILIDIQHDLVRNMNTLRSESSDLTAIKLLYLTTIIKAKHLQRVVLIETTPEAIRKPASMKQPAERREPFISLALITDSKPPYWDGPNKEIFAISGDCEKIEKLNHKYIPILKSQECKDNENLVRYFDSLSCTRKVRENTIILKNTDFWEVLRALTLDLKESGVPDLDTRMIKLTKYISTQLISHSYYLAITLYDGLTNL